MNINELTIGQAKEITAMFPADTPVRGLVDHGFCIAVMDKGFVYVGDVSTDGQFVRIKRARNIRRWGTERGLGQLALEGPQENTKLDKCGDICAPIAELKHLMKCEVLQWMQS